MVESLKEISKYLSPDTRFDLRLCALNHVLHVTANADGRELLLKLPEMLKQLVTFVQDSSAPISKCAAQALVNITGDEAGTSAILIISESSNATENTDEQNVNDLPGQGFSQNLIKICMRIIMDKSSTLADLCCMILSNMTRPFHLVDRVIMIIEQSGYSWDEIVAAFTAKQYNTTGNKLHYLGPVFSNLSQSPHVRRYLMDRDRCVIQRLLPFTEYPESLIRRGGVVGTLKNCTFDTECHEWLLSPEVDLLSYLLLPLAGPEEFDDEDNDKLPINLQYLPETKTREPDPDIRLMLLEALNQLCATKAARKILREKNAYVILRELHKWEKDKNCLLACENVVDILIRTEEEIGLDNLKKVEVPSEYTETFRKIDEDFISNT